MSRPDERALRPRPDRVGQGARGIEADGDSRPPSKTQRKTEMHALQDLGEALIGLEPQRLAELAAQGALPEQLVQAVQEARAITAWGGRRRQMKYVGKLMREIDPERVRRRL